MSCADHLSRLPYSRKYWQELKICGWVPNRLCKFVVQHGTDIHNYNKFILLCVRILAFIRQTAKPPNSVHSLVCSISPLRVTSPVMAVRERMHRSLKHMGAQHGKYDNVCTIFTMAPAGKCIIMQDHSLSLQDYHRRSHTEKRRKVSMQL